MHSISQHLGKLVRWGLPASGLGVTLHLGLQGQVGAAIATGGLSLGLAVLTLGRKLSERFWARLEERLGDRVEALADWVVDQLSNGAVRLWWQLSGRTLPRYHQFLIYRYRDYRTQGLKTRGPFALNLEQVFVPLRLAPGMARQSGWLLGPEETGRNLRIWSILAAMRTQPAFRRLVILGSPGSGKTTLLEHIALTYARSRHRRQDRRLASPSSAGAPRLIPVLLYLRDLAPSLQAETSPPDLASLIEVHWQALGFSTAPGWLQRQLQGGRCLVMLDGLDELGTLPQRQRVRDWVMRQIQRYPSCAFILTSRPYGYRDAPLEGVTTLEIQAFSLDQIQRFLHNWYLENEVMRHLGRRDRGVRAIAREQAEDLGERIRRSPPLAAMALNPLLLTMIATVHAFRGVLPGRRVELYAEICDVLLGRRQEAKGLGGAIAPEWMTEPSLKPSVEPNIKLSVEPNVKPGIEPSVEPSLKPSVELSVEQKKALLQALAYKLTSRRTREFKPYTGRVLIQKTLRAVAGDRLSPEQFFAQIETLSGLLVERQPGVYEFAHRSFQDYLTALQVKVSRREFLLTRNIDDAWWQEVIRLYAAENDASALVWAALEQNTVATLSLALDCLEEGLSVDPDLRETLEAHVSQGLESADGEVFQLAAEVKLNRRLQGLLRLDEAVEVDLEPMSWAEYQLFLEEQRFRGREFRPDGWAIGCDAEDLGGAHRFPAGQAAQPVRGIRASDAQAFCLWLSDRLRDLGETFLQAGSVVSLGRSRIRLPLAEELANVDLVKVGVAKISPAGGLSPWTWAGGASLPALAAPELAQTETVLGLCGDRLDRDLQTLGAKGWALRTEAFSRELVRSLLPEALVLGPDPLNSTAWEEAMALLRRWSSLASRWDKGLEGDRQRLLGALPALEQGLPDLPPPLPASPLPPSFPRLPPDLQPSAEVALQGAIAWQTLAEIYQGLSRKRAIAAQQQLSPSACTKQAERYGHYARIALRFYLAVILADLRRSGTLEAWEALWIVRETKT